MSCNWKSPTDALNGILMCAQTSLGEQPCFGVPGQIVVGGAGADRAFSCCADGMLSVTFEQISRSQDSIERRRTSGNGPCNEEFEFDVHVKVLRCVATFEIDGGGGTTSGASISPERRTEASLGNVAEAWKFLKDLNCCTSGCWKGCDAVVMHQTILPPRGSCFGHETVIHVSLKSCCSQSR